MLANEVVGLAAKVNKIMEAAGRLVAPVDDIRHIRGEDKGGTVPGPRGTNIQVEGQHGGGSPLPCGVRQGTVPLVTCGNLDRWGSPYLLPLCFSYLNLKRPPETSFTDSLSVSYQYCFPG